MKLNPKFLEELARAPGVRRVENQFAAAAGKVARTLHHNIMPRDHEPVIQVDGNRLANTAHGGHIDEFGAAAQNTPAYAPLRRAARMAGARVRNLPKG